MVARLLRDALEGVRPADRAEEFDEAVRVWGCQLGRLAASPQRDPYLQKAPEILAAGAGLARRLAAAPGYASVALTVRGVLAGIQGREGGRALLRREALAVLADAGIPVHGG